MLSLGPFTLDLTIGTGLSLVGFLAYALWPCKWAYQRGIAFGTNDIQHALHDYTTLYSKIGWVLFKRDLLNAEQSDELKARTISGRWSRFLKQLESVRDFRRDARGEPGARRIILRMLLKRVRFLLFGESQTPLDVRADSGAPGLAPELVDILRDSDGSDPQLLKLVKYADSFNLRRWGPSYREDSRYRYDETMHFCHGPIWNDVLLDYVRRECRRQSRTLFLY